MSEPITKACEECSGTGVVDLGSCEQRCPWCDGLCRVPDVEGQLRAEVARLTQERDYHQETCAELQASVLRLSEMLKEEDVEIERLKTREKDASSLISELRGLLRDYGLCTCEHCVARNTRIDAWFKERE